jgi:tRNA pseudouridine13 synthase
MSIDPKTREEMVNPPVTTGHLPSVKADFKLCPEDFQVDEIPAYEPDGQEDAHLLLQLKKRDWNTASAVDQVARQLDIPRLDVGVAGQKDRFAVTTQWISLPGSCADRLRDFSHADIELGEAFAHGNKLRRGHLHGNRFRVLLRNLEPDSEAAKDMVRAKLDELHKQGGLENHFGLQRFGYDGANLERGVGLLAHPKRIRRGDMMLSALQSALFNLYLLRRRQKGLLGRILEGDLLRKIESGGMFESMDPVVDQGRFDEGELALTGPIFGSKMRAPAEGTESWKLEQSILEECELDPLSFKALGKKGVGSRRQLMVPMGDVLLESVGEYETVQPSREGDASPEKVILSAGLALSFALPSGSYATRLLREIMES